MPAVATRKPVVAYNLWPKQMQVFMRLDVDGVNQILFGGSAGGAKSHALRARAFHLSQMWPGARIAIFREAYTQLAKTQIVKWHAEMGRLGMDMKDYWREAKGEWSFPNPHNPGQPTVVEFLHLDQSIGAEKWQSAEFAFLGIDEATQIGHEDIELLYSRVRVDVALKELWRQLADDREAQANANPEQVVANITRRLQTLNGHVDEERNFVLGPEPTKDEIDAAWPDEVKLIRTDWHPSAVYATNPGGVSHEYFKSRFIDESAMHGGEPWDVTETVSLDGEEVDLTIRRFFLPSRLTDNPAIDPREYAANLAHLSNQRRREQLLAGDWDFFEGKVFDMLSEDVHFVDARRAFGGRMAPPSEWPRLGGLDHGTTSPTAAEWLTRDEDGFLIAYLEYYSAGNVSQHVEAIRSLMMLDGRHDLLWEADPRMWQTTKGYSRVWTVADEYEYGGEPPEESGDRALARSRGIRLHMPNIERIAGRVALQRMFEPDPNRIFPDWHPKAGQHGAPRLFISTACPNLWRELNNLRFVEGSEETVKENDHCLHGDTIVDTEDGPRRIADLVGTEGRVWGYDGLLHQYRRARKTHESVEVMRLVTADGREVVATPDHRFLMADATWRELQDIEPGERLFDITTTVRYSLPHGRNQYRDDTQGHPPAGLPGDEVLPLWGVLPAGRGATAPEGLAGPLRPDSRGLACASQVRPGSQRGRGFGTQAGVRSPVGAQSQRFAESEGGSARESEGDRRMASLTRGVGVASRAWTRLMGRPRPAPFAQPVRRVRRAVCDLLPRPNEGVLEDLPPREGQQVARVERAGEADVYNIAVDDVFSFSVEGGLIAHNSYDALYRAAVPFEQAILVSQRRAGPVRTIGYRRAS